MESTEHREPWNKGKLIGQKPPLKCGQSGQPQSCQREFGQAAASADAYQITESWLSMRCCWSGPLNGTAHWVPAVRSP